ncbi:hypothetical protein ACOMHN_035361 [Nucella lapillus]
MASGYTRFDEPNRSVSVTSRSGDSADSSSDIQLDIGDDDGGKVSVTSVHGFIMDPATNLEIMTPLESLQLKVKKVVEHLLFRIFTVVLIMLDFILVVIDLSISNCVSSNNGLEIMSHGIITFFLLEVAFRVFCKGKIFFDVILDVIDMLVVVISFIIDMVFVVISPSDCLEKENDKTAFARLIVIGRVVRIVRIARILYIAYMQRKHVSAATRQLVSQNKRRYQKDGFDLDLCYITERVIAMSFPSKGLMAVYRNPVEDVARFFNTKHEGHYKIFNLCSERKYDETLFHNCVERIFIDDHNVPKVREMLTFCDTAREWMAADPANIIAIHCKGGKGRTGTIICIWLIDCGLFEGAKVRLFSVWLLDCGLFEGAKTSLEYFGDRRTDLTKGTAFQGVETPSQSRYVGYFEKIKNEYNRHMPPRKLLKIKSFKIVGIGTVGNGDGSDLFIELRQDNISVFECDMGTEVNCKVSTFPDSDSVVIEPQNCPNVEGDIKVMFKTKNKKIPIGYDKCPFYFWFYTSFIEDNQLVLERDELDNPHKPKTHHVFGPNFSVIIDFETVELDDE